MELLKGNYTQLQAGAIIEFKLNGNELILFSVILGFTQAKNMWCTASLDYLGEWISSTDRSNTSRVLNRLISKGLVEKETYTDDLNNKRCKYRVPRPIVKMTMGDSQNDNTPVVKMTTNNINDNNKETKPIGLVKKNSQKRLEERQKDFADTLVPFVEYYGKEMIRAFYDYWSEPTLDGKKMRLELEKTFEINRRLAYWYRRGQSNK